MNGFRTLIFSKSGPVAWITLNRPAVHNALNLEMRDELWSILDAVEIDPDIKVAVFHGAGDEAFCSGADLNDFGSAASLIEARRGRRERDLWGRLAQMSKPSLAAVNGFALGAGFELSLLCDIRLASENATFGMPEVKLGYLPSAGGTQMLARTAGLGRAASMVLSGEPIDAGTAFEYGLVTRVVPLRELAGTAAAVAEKVAGASAAAVRATRRAVNEGLDLTLAEGIALEARLALDLRQNRDSSP